MSSAGARVLYDAECRFCRWSLGWLLRWDRDGALEPVALQDPRATELLAGMDERERGASWHLVDPRGEVTSAGAAVAPMLRLLPMGPPIAAVLERVPRAVEWIYGLVAGHRGRLGRALGDGAVARADALIARREPAHRGPPLP